MEKIIYGKFAEDGFRGEDGKVYPVPANYVSKSRLLVGDKLKLFISENNIIYKQIELVPRKTAMAVVQHSFRKYYARSIDGEIYEIPYASASFYRLSDGDEVMAIMPLKKEDSGEMCAIDGVIKTSK